MPVINMQDMLTHARHNRYAVASFELLNLDCLDAALQAAEKTQAPVILSINEAHIATRDFAPMISATLCMARESTVPVAVHLEAGKSPESAVRAIRYGCNAISMYASTKPLEDYIESTRRAAAMAGDCGIPAGGTIDTGDSDAAAFAAAVKDFAGKTKVSYLTLMKHGDEGVMEFLEQCQSLDIPLALDEAALPSTKHVSEAIDHGVAKINCSDALCNTVVQTIRRVTAKDDGTLLSLGQPVRQALTEVAEQRLRAWGGAGQANAVLEYARRCREVAHAIIYNVEESGQDSAQEMMATGRKVLSTIPGVREVFTGRAVQQDASYQYCWLVRFADAAVIDSYRDHPDHQEFADTLFRPMAANRISIDYESTE